MHLRTSAALAVVAVLSTLSAASAGPVPGIAPGPSSTPGAATSPTAPASHAAPRATVQLTSDEARAAALKKFPGATAVATRFDRQRGVWVVAMTMPPHFERIALVDATGKVTLAPIPGATEIPVPTGRISQQYAERLALEQVPGGKVTAARFVTTLGKKDPDYMIVLVDRAGDQKLIAINADTGKNDPLPLTNAGY